jgi:hypothetical protein
MQQYYHPLPTNSVVERLNELSRLLGWGRLTIDGHVCDKITHHSSRPWFSIWWQSEWKSRSQFVVSPYSKDIHRSRIPHAKDAFDWFVLFTAGDYPIKAGRLRIFLPSSRKIESLADALSPMFHAAHFRTSRSRANFLQRFPHCDLNSPERNPNRIYHLVNGQIAEDKRGDIHKPRSKRFAKN